MEPLSIDRVIQPHKSFIELVVKSLPLDARIIGISVVGSIVNGIVDQYSDIDFIIAVDPLYYNSVIEERMAIVSKYGNILTGFSGEHVGDSRLLICLYDKPLLHVDYKFVSLDDVSKETSQSQLVWERDKRFSSLLDQIQSKPFQMNDQWIEDRFWIWIHYAGTKIARGETFEVLDFLSFIRSNVLVPLALASEEKIGFGVRKIETILPAFAIKLTATIASDNKESMKAAVEACINLYLELRAKVNPSELDIHKNCELRTKQFIQAIQV
ncbi:oxalate:formate antiporter [bacterium]|nr:oxalate:formate antiporter [bacterium]